MVQCPRGCDKEPVVLSGTKYFAFSSKICHAGIYSGAITSGVGGIFYIRRSEPLSLYPGGKVAGITSTEL